MEKLVPSVKLHGREELGIVWMRGKESDHTALRAAFLI